MHGKVVGLVPAAALLASVGIANAKGPVTLTDGQLDKITAGASQTSTSVSATQQLNTLLALNTQTLNNLLALNTAGASFFNALFALPTSP